MPKFVNIRKGSKMKSHTLFTENAIGENVVLTSLHEQINLSADPGHMNLALGRAVRGSFTPMLLPDGKIGLCMRPYGHDEHRAPQSETLTTTRHGRLYRTQRHLRVVLEFSVNESFDEVSDLLDDEIFEIREYLRKEEKC